MASLQKSLVVKKEFNYRKGGVTLGFTLTIDNESELKDFRSLLIEARKDVESLMKDK